MRLPRSFQSFAMTNLDSEANRQLAVRMTNERNDILPVQILMTTLYIKQQIQTRIQELAEEINKDYKGESILLISILKSSFVLTADLIRALYEAGMTTVDVDFLQISSYGTAKQSSGDPKVVADITTDIKNKHILIVEDIIDTGHTLKFVREYLGKLQPASLKILAFLDKKAAREIEVAVEYVGFTLEDTPWVEGYGMDGGEFGRGRPDIAEKK